MQHRIIILIIFSLIVSLQPALAAPLHQSGEGDAYVVQADDWLSKIADKFYGDVLAYPVIVAATNAKAIEDDTFSRITNPDLIEIGQTLWIPAEDQPTTLTGEALKNSQYSGIYQEPPFIQLSDGLYEGEPFVPGGASRPTVTLIDQVIGFGDLNGDGQDDAAVILVENSGGSGAFLYLAAMINQNGIPLNVATTFIGDRFQPTAISISGHTITLAAISHGPDDPLCCPTVESNLTYHLIGDQLVDSAQEAAGLYKGFFIAASSPGRDSTLSLNVDQTVRLETDYLNDEPPLVEVGTWAITAAGLIDVTLTGQVDRPYDQPAGFTATLTDSILTVADAPPGAIVDSWIEISALALGQQPVPYDPTKLDQLVADHGFIGLYKTYLPSASCCGRDVTLLLGTNQMAQLKTDYLNGEPAIIEIGQWETNADNQVLLTLTGRADQPYPTPTQITFAWVDHKLTTIESDQNQFGSTGLSFYHTAGMLASIQLPE